MSISQTISSWKQKSEVDYFSLFVPLWLAFDAWCKDKYGLSDQRRCLEALKNDEINNKTYHKMKSLLNGNDSMSITFKSHLNQLEEALKSNPIYYEEAGNVRSTTTTLSFKNALTDRSVKKYENLFRTSGQHNKIEIVPGLYVTDEIQKIYKGYIEILYQVRCYLFHGNLKPDKENERIIKNLYLTLKDLLNEI